MHGQKSLSLIFFYHLWPYSKVSGLKVTIVFLGRKNRNINTVRMHWYSIKQVSDIFFLEDVIFFQNATF